MYEFLRRLDKRDLILFTLLAEKIMRLGSEHGMRGSDLLFFAQCEELALSAVIDREIYPFFDSSHLTVITTYTRDQLLAELIQTDVPESFSSFVNTLDLDDQDEDDTPGGTT